MKENNPFKYHSLESLKRETSPIIYVITEEMVQDLAEENYGGRLTEMEVNQLLDGFRENDQLMYLFMAAAIEYAIEVAEAEAGKESVTP